MTYGKDLVRGLLDGVVDPDRNPDLKLIVRSRRRRSYVRRVPVRQHGGVNKALVHYYYCLALYHYRNGNDYMAGRALGRAIHYVQDGVLQRKKWMGLVDVHDELESEIEIMVKEGFDFSTCSQVIKESNKPGEVLCSAYVGTVELLSKFSSEASANVDKEFARSRVRTIKRIKWLSGTLTALAYALAITQALATVVLTPLVITALISIASLKPRAYWEAMKAGILIVKPSGYITAM